MNRKIKLLAFLLILLGVLVLVAAVAYGSNMQVLNPKGTIAHSQRNLLVFGAILSAVIVLPVFWMTFHIAWKYRADNKEARYTPDWDHSRIAETVWWTVPLMLIVVLSVVTWRSSHDLDPFKPLQSTAKPLTIQVVALQWKWLFIYPDQHVATVNFVPIPVGTPIDFQITSDAPMNSFWIPQLGGQIYAMSGMSTHLHLLASEVGDYRGSSANISGDGFAGMHFTAHAMSPADFDAWVADTKLLPTALSAADYAQLAEPSDNNPQTAYAATPPNLYDTIIAKYMTPGHILPTSAHHHGGDE